MRLSMYKECGTQVVTSEKRRKDEKRERRKIKTWGQAKREKRGNNIPILKIYLTPKIIYEMGIF